MSISDSLTLLGNTKTAIKNKINELGGSVLNNTPFADYPAKIAEMTGNVYNRPADWLNLPTVTNTEQKMVGLYAVFNHGSNMVAMTIAGAYTVDWGDGSAAENFATGATAIHLFNYANLGAETLCSQGYKQAIITVTPQGGSNLTSINLNVRYTGWAYNYSTQWLDILLSAPNLTTLTVGASTQYVYHWMLERFQLISTNSVSSFAYGLNNSRLLRSASLVVNSATNLSYCFQNCFKLIDISVTNTSLVTDYSYLFNGCNLLQKIATLDTGNGVNFSYMFQSCSSLKKAPLLDYSKGTNFTYIFGSCNLLEKASISVNSATNLSNMFAGCGKLKEVEVTNSNLVTNFTSTFAGCSALQTFSSLDTSNGTTFTNMFQNCVSLLSVPLLDTSKGTNMTSMFQGCTALEMVPALVTSAVSSSANQGNILGNCYNISSAPLSGTKYSISYSGCRLSTDAIVAIFNNLATVTSQTITLTGAWQSSLLTAEQLAIATGKGWTVTQ